MMASGQGSTTPARPKRAGHALLTAALLSETISGGHAFLTPPGFTSFQQINGENSKACDDQQINIHASHKHARTQLFAVQYNYNDEDQWGDETDSAYGQQANMNEYSAFQEEPEYEQRYYYEGTKRAILGGVTLGTVMAINNAVGMSVGAETATLEAPVVSSGGVLEQYTPQSYSAILNAQPDVTLPYLEQQIQAAEEAFENQYGQPAAVASTTVPGTTTTTVAAAPAPECNVGATSSSETTAAFSPSFVRYTQEHMPEWIETGYKIYDAAAPKVAAGGQKIIAEVDKRVTPMVIEKEHELLGEANSAVLDKTILSVASAGKMVAGMIGKVVSFGIEGGIQVAKATPEVIKMGQQIYKTVDEKILPEVVDTSRRMKLIVDKTVPEVMDTGKHAYDTIMPEFINAEKQVATTVKSGVDMAMPAVKEIENKIMPEFSKIQRGVLGEERAVMVERTVAEVAQQGQGVFQTVEKRIPQVWASSQKTVDNVANTGRTVARVVPEIVETGKQAYNYADQSISSAISTTQDIASDLDRAAGKTAYAIENNLNGFTGTIDKTIPALLEVGRQAAVSGSEIARGSKAIYEDVVGFVDDVTVENTINSAGKRFAATKPTSTFREVTASVNDPNQLGKL